MHARLGPQDHATAVATIALWADGFSLAEMRDVSRDLRKRIYTLDGIRKVEIFGTQDEQIYLDFSPAKLAESGVAADEIVNVLSQQNIIEPGGEIAAGDRSVLIVPSGDLESLDELRNVLILVSDTNRFVRLDELVDIRREHIDPPKFPAFFNNRPSIILSVSTAEGVDNVAFGETLKTFVATVQQELPIGYVLEFVTFQPELIEEAVGSAISNVYQTLGIVLVVVMLFLGLRTGLIVGAFVPLTMLLGMIVMGIAEIELQRMSIAATIIALGLLVDNGIVVAEDIRVRLENGMDRFAAAIASGKTLAIPLLTSSLTTIMAFMPMLLVEGGTGEFVRSLSQVVSILLLSSWLLSMTVTPCMCAWFMKVPAKGGAKAPSAAGGDAAPDPDSKPDQDEGGFGPMVKGYTAILSLVMRARLVFLAVIVGLLIGAVQVLGLVKTEFFPLGERNQFLVYLDFEAGVEPRGVLDDAKILTNWLADTDANPEVASHIAYVGFGGPRFFLALSPVDPDPHRVFVLVTTKSPDDVDPMIAKVNAFMDGNLPAARADAKKMWFGSTEPGVVQIKFIGPDSGVLAGAGEATMAALHDVPGTVGIKQDWENRILRLDVDVDQVRARRAGVSSSDVAKAINASLTGATISEFREGDKLIPIILRGDSQTRFSLAGLQRIQVYSPINQNYVLLSQVATIKGSWEFSRIKREAQQRTLTVEARNPGIAAPQLLAAIQPTLDGLDLPAGTTWEIGGEIADQAEANQRLFAFLPLMVFGIAALLIGQFNSFRKGGIIMITIPLILIGGVLGLVVMQAPYGFMVLLGFFSLAGILINNGIVLIDRIIIEEEAGRSGYEAVITACVARLRPILMTTLTTVLGLIPLILFGGALFYGMASAIAFGLIVATVLTLGVVP
ncbi:MAG: efflux RND transporter permease subunit, partial [Rhodospirillaceae bacterium]